MFQLKVDPTNSFKEMTVIEFSERCGEILHLLKQAYEVGMDLRTALKPVFGENPERVEVVFTLDGEIYVPDSAGYYETAPQAPVAVVTVDDEVCRIYKDTIAIITPNFDAYVVVT